MTDLRTPDRIAGLVRGLCGLPHETEWVEFKMSQSNPQLISEYLSALSNGAALNGKPAGYLVWGVENGAHVIVGTRFAPGTAKKGGEPLHARLLRLLTPRMDFRFHEAMVKNRRVVLLEIGAARTQPVALVHPGRRGEEAASRPPGTGTGALAGVRGRPLRVRDRRGRL